MAEKQSLMSSFLEITAGGQSPAHAVRYLEAANWCLEDALELFLSGAVVGNPAASGNSDTCTPENQEHSSDHEDEEEHEDNDVDEDYELPEEDDDGVGAAPPVPRDAWSYQSELIADFNAASTHRRQQGGDEDGAASSAVAGGLREMFTLPAGMLFRGTFNAAKEAGVRKDQWLLVNVQSGRDRISSLLNREVWSEDVLSYLIKSKFVFWQVDQAWPEGQKVCTYFKQDLLPVILVVDPITGKMMRVWTGVVTPEDLLEYLLPLSRQSPREHLFATSRKRPSETKETSPPTSTTSIGEGSTRGRNDAPVIRELPPRYERLSLAKGPDEDGDGVCRIGVRLPDGRRLQRRFLRSDTIRMLWSFCLQHLEEDAGDAARGFHFIFAAPGASKVLEYESGLSFEEEDLTNALIYLVWD